MNYSERYVRKKSDRLLSKGARRGRRVLVSLLRLSFVLLIVGVLYISYLGYRYFHEMIDDVPDIRTIELTPAGTPSRILDSDGEVVMSLEYADTYREQVILDKIPKYLQNAFIASEDQSFWSHDGINAVDVLRMYISSLSGGTFSRETDTITQQLLKNQVLTVSDDKDWISRARRKFQEIYLALSMETRYTKDEILEYYLNTIYLGQNTLGVGAASLRYFNKQVSELTLPECALLAAIAKNPSAYDPIRHSSRNRRRELQVLTAMQDQGLITSDEYEQAIEDDVQSRVQRYDEAVDGERDDTSYFMDTLKEELIEDMKSSLGYSDTQAMMALHTRGLTIYSTRDSDLQKICDKVLSNQTNYPQDIEYQLSYQLTIQHTDGSQVSYSFNDIREWYEENSNPIKSYFPSEKKARQVIRPFRRQVLSESDRVIAETIHITVEPQVSFVLIDSSGGEIRALVGGRNESETDLINDRSTNSIRQPGAILSVLSTYLPALDTAGMTLGTVQDDTEYNYPGSDQPVVNRYGDAYRGLITMRDSITNPSNVVAVKTLEQMTPKIGYDYLLNLGLTSLNDGYSDDTGQSYTDISLSLAVGDLTRGVSNRELTGAFSAIADGGIYRKPHLYTKIIDSEERVLIDKTTVPGRRIMKESTAWLLTDTMEGENPSSGMCHAGISGTSENGSDLWYVGFTPYLTAGIWCGYDGSKGQEDTTYHTKLWNKIMRRINGQYVDIPSFEKPGDIVTATICTKCGKLAIDDLCEDAVGGSCVRDEYYTAETVPTETCDCHVRCRICSSSGLLAGDGCPDEDVSEVVYLQKKDENSEDGKTMDSSLIMPSYLIDSICEVHNSVTPTGTAGVPVSGTAH